MKVEMIDLMGGDLTVVNSARVSFDKISTQFKDKEDSITAGTPGQTPIGPIHQTNKQE